MLLTRIAMAFDPGIKPSTTGLPPSLIAWLKSIGSGLAGAALIILGIGFAISAVSWAAGKWGPGTQRMQSGGASGMLVTLVAAFLIAAASALIAFFARAGAAV